MSTTGSNIPKQEKIDSAGDKTGMIDTFLIYNHRKIQQSVIIV